MGFSDLFKNKKKRKDDEKYRIGLEKTGNVGAFRRLKQLFSRHASINDELFEELEEIFLAADIGVETSLRFIRELKADPRIGKISDTGELQPLIADKMFDLYLKGEVVASNLTFNKNGLTVFLFVGVNGVGKTTTIAKVAFKLIGEGKKVIVAAGDTFRAGAAEQLLEWGRRIGFETVTKPSGSDPGSVVYDAIVKAKAQGADVLLCDTAGRLQTKVNLMRELTKIKKVISREAEGAPHETLLIIDATTGQNGLSQAKAFTEATAVTGIILTKLDGTAKGGIVLAIRENYNIPIKFVGLGEKVDDLEYFDIDKYIGGLFPESIDCGERNE